MLTELMEDPDVRLVTLIGAGGVGKTRLLVEMARRLEPGYADGAVFVRLERSPIPRSWRPRSPALWPCETAPTPSADGLASYLHEREVLIAADNFEHLLPAAVLIAELLALAPKIRVLVSSRAKLSIRGEQVFEVEPLGLPTSESEGAAADSPAVQRPTPTPGRSDTSSCWRVPAPRG